jgi:hypothetical protein
LENKNYNTKYKPNHKKQIHEIKNKQTKQNSRQKLESLVKPLVFYVPAAAFQIDTVPPQ